MLEGLGRALERGLTALNCAQRVGETDALRIGDDASAAVPAAARARGSTPSG